MGEIVFFFFFHLESLLQGFVFWGQQKDGWEGAVVVTYKVSKFHFLLKAGRDRRLLSRVEILNRAILPPLETLSNGWRYFWCLNCKSGGDPGILLGENHDATRSCIGWPSSSQKLSIPQCPQRHSWEVLQSQILGIGAASLMCPSKLSLANHSVLSDALWTFGM